MGRFQTPGSRKKVLIWTWSNSLIWPLRMVW
ncbi:hypothetical protein GB937_010922 [Aspergillus fischeri]|nr:hypothetical protein GB937_010922 [Aspergillus fischeri]